MKLIGNAFSYIFSFCYRVTNNYWLAIIVFTFISKIILLPISIIVQKNSIKMVQMYPEINRIKAKFFGNKDMISEKQYKLYKEKDYKPLLDIIPAIVQVVVLMGVVAGFPEDTPNRNILLTIGAALSSFILCFVQNKENVLQSEQSKANKIGVMSFSICLSLFLALFVSKYVVFYWICSNLMSAGQVFILNYFINPNKYIDYRDLRQSKNELNAIIEQNKKIAKNRSKELIDREKRDYKRFIKYQNKQIVFYSERNGFYKYYKDIIEVILKKTDIIIHYISSDPNDEIFALSNDNFQTYYIDEKIMILMMQMDADIVVMTTPDLQNYYIKRSMVRDDIEYVFIDHATNSNNLSYHKEALAHFDTVFVQNTRTYDEIRAQEKLYGFNKKNLVKVGYPLIDNMIKSYCENSIHQEKTILIAPSWQEDNIFDLCIDDILSQLIKTDYQIILRPHPQYVKLFKNKYDLLKEKYLNYSNIIFQDDFSSNKTVYDADVLITDWSGIALEYSFATLKPTVFINTPMKILNPDYKDIDIVPFDIESRSKIGIEIEVDDIDTINNRIEDLFANKAKIKEDIRNTRDNYLYNIGNSAKYGAKYLVDSLINKYNKQLDSEIIIDDFKEEKENNKFSNRLKESFVICLFVCLTLFFFSPMEIYLGNYADFLFPVNNVWWVLLGFAVVCSVILSLLISIFTKRISRCLCLLELIFGLMCYIQMMFLNGKTVTLFATADDVIFDFSTRLINLVIWLIVILSFIIIYFNNKKIKNSFYKISKYVCIFLIIIQSAGFISSITKIDVKNHDFYYLTNNGEFELSGERNTIVFLLDFCDGDVVTSTLKKYPDLFENLDGFTYYPDATTTYSRTYPSLTYLLTEQKCYYDLPYNKYINDAWDNADCLLKLKENGVDINLYTSINEIGENANKYINNCSHYDTRNADFINKEQLIKEMILFSAYRCAPYSLKTLCNRFFNGKVNYVINYPEDMCIEEEDPSFYEALLKNGLDTSNKYDKAFRFYHFTSTHGYLNKNVQYLVDGDTPSKEDTLFAVFKILNYYIDQMKQLGIYDNSTIVIMTDHGDSGKHYIEVDGPATGILLIKQKNETGIITTSNASICHEDLFPLLYEERNIKEYVKEEFNSDKIRYCYRAVDDETKLLEYMITGDARDKNNWHRTNNDIDIEYSFNVK